MNIVHELRKKKGVQQKDLAAAIGVSIPSVSNWEHGKSDPSGERLKKLSEYFGVDELVILGHAPEQKSESEPSQPVGISETERIVQHVLERLGVQQQTPEISIVSSMMSKMSKQQQDQVVAVVRAMFQNNQ